MTRYGRDWFTPDGLDVSDVFREVYRHNLWGQGEEVFYSGTGSDAEPTALYINAVTQYIARHQIKSVVDLGCGDFRVGGQLCKADITYHGVDIVPELINHHLQHYSSKSVTFSCLNAISDALPTGDLCLIRQVLQHLSNKHISVILNKVKTFQHLIVTEHVLPQTKITHPNLDIADGPGTRLDQGSSVLLEEPPFSYPLSNLCSVQQADGTLLRTDVIARQADR